MPSTKAMRYAHSDGFTDVCFDSTGRYILTCGSDGDVRIWDGVDDDDAISHRCGDKAFAIAFKNGRYFTATDTNTIQAYTFPDGSPDGILTRFTAPANHIVVNNSGSTLVAGSSDFSIKIVDTSNCSYKTCQGHEAPVLSLALDPRQEYLVSSSCDGTVRVWKMEDRHEMHRWTLIPKCSDVTVSKTVCRMGWDNEGKWLYVPVEKEVHIYQRDTWTKVGSLTDGVLTQYVSVLAITTDGLHLAAGCSDGWICIFDLKTKKCIDKHRNEKGQSITSLAWNPKANLELTFCDNQGQLGILYDIATTTSEHTKREDSTVPGGVFDDEDDDFLLEATNKEDGADSDSDIDADSIPRPSKPVLSDDDSVSLPDMKPDDDASSVTSDRPAPPRPVVVEGFKPTPMQRPFQPGSTPQHLSSRFMVWNSVGIVRQYNSEDENSVDVEFHDTSVHHAMHINNNNNYCMGDVSSEAVLLAAEADPDTPSKLTCMHFASWDNNKEWSTTMPGDEDIQALVLGEGWAAVATDQRNVRLFSIAGVQKQLFSIAGPVVCMATHSSQLLIVYHRGMAIPGDQCLGVCIVDVRDWRQDVNDEALPLSATATLSWIGFSAEGTPFYVDSTGIVRMMNRTAAKTWVQVADTKSHTKGMSDHYWIVGIHENPQQIRCIPCKGSRFPATLPRPAVSVLPFQLPVCELSTEKSQYEELLWRTNIMAAHFDQWTRLGYEFDETLKTEALKPSQEALMKLFALSARSERECRALEVCEMMTDQHTLQLAIKYSSRMRYIQLAQRISEMAVRKAEEEEARLYEQSEREEARVSWSAQRTCMGDGNPGEETGVGMDDGQAGVDVELEEEQQHVSGPMLKLKPKDHVEDKSSSIVLSRHNPFKVTTSHATSGVAKGSQVFDSLAKKKEKPAVTPVLLKPTGQKTQKTQKQSSQPKLFMKKKQDNKSTPAESPTPSTKSVSAFELWLAENQERLRGEGPGDDGDFTKFAAEQFRSMSSADRQEWLKKARSLNDKTKENSDINSTDGSDKKRKREDTDLDDSAKKLKDSANADSDVKKTPLSQSTNSKLSNFMFQKTGE